MDDRSWYALPFEGALEAFGSHADKGLSMAEAEKRLLVHANQLPLPTREGIATRIYHQLTSPIALVLLLAALGTIFISHYTDAIVIALALLVNVAIGIFQEGKASSAFEALQKEEAPRAVVVREGLRREIPAREVVEGDLLILSAGAKVAADARLIESHGLLIQEAALTGEWLPVEKNIEPVTSDTPLALRLNSVYAGTLVSSGAGTAVVVATGEDTELGAIAKELQQTLRSETPLQKDIKGIARFLLGFVALTILFIGGLALYQGMTVGETLLIAISIAVASIPEGLPAAVTVVLALGMQRILKEGGLVRNLLAAETLGATSVILTDKTGTLTEGKMKAVGYVTLSGTTEQADGPSAQTMLRAAVLASDGYLEEVTTSAVTGETIVARGRPVEQAILLAGLEAGFPEQALRSAYPRLDELHFNSTRRYGGMFVQEEGRAVAYVTGVPELFLSHAAHELGTRGGDRTFTKEHQAYYHEALTRAAKEGKRVLAVGRIEAEQAKFPREEDLDGFLLTMELLGFIVFSDVIRSDAKASVQKMQDAGARVIMLTGDNPETALWFAEQVGIAKEGERAYTGAELSGLSDDALVTLLNEHTVFARVAPTDKLRIARVLMSSGEVVAMTGDGVNDAPALEASAIGVALGSGTDVAKEASDLILLNDSFSVITKAIEEGRRLRGNIKKMLAYMLSTNFSEIFIITSSLIVGLPIPILPTQIMWANLIEGGPMNVALAFEPLYPSAMKRSPKHPDVAQVLSQDLLKLILTVGILTGLMLIALHFYLFSTGIPEDELRTIMFGAISASSVAGALSLKSFGTPLWKLKLWSNPWLFLSLLGSIVMLLIALYVPWAQAIVHTVPVSFADLLIMVAAGVMNLGLIELAKQWFFIGPLRKLQHSR